MSMDDREELIRQIEEMRRQVEAGLSQVREMHDQIQEHLMQIEEWTATTGHSLKALDLEDLVAQVEPLLLVTTWALDGLESQLSGKNLMGLAAPFGRLATLAIKNVLRVFAEVDGRGGEVEGWDEGEVLRLAQTLKDGQTTLVSLVKRFDALMSKVEKGGAGP
jgi:septation ring formation regulator EzrA